MLGHQGTCPTVKAIEYFPDGTVKRVEFKCTSDYMPIPAQIANPGLEQALWSQTMWRNAPCSTS